MKKIEVIVSGSKWAVVEDGIVLHEFHLRLTAEMAAHSLQTVGSLNQTVDAKPRWEDQNAR